MFYFVLTVLCLGVVAAWTAATPRKAYMDQVIRRNAESAEFSRRCQNDPAWPAEEKFSKDTARFRRDNAYRMPLGRPLLDPHTLAA